MHRVFDQCMKQNVLCRALLVRQSLVLCTQGASCIWTEHVASSQGSDWLLSKSTFASQMAGGEWSRLYKRTVDSLNSSPLNLVSCTARVIKIRVKLLLCKHTVVTIERRVLDTGSSEGRQQWQAEGQQQAPLGYTCVSQHVLIVCIDRGQPLCCESLCSLLYTCSSCPFMV